MRLAWSDMVGLKDGELGEGSVFGHGVDSFPLKGMIEMLVARLRETKEHA